MKIYSVYDPEFKPYGQIVEGMEETIREILDVLKDTPLPEGTGYVPEDQNLQELPAMTEVSEHLYGGMPVQLGWCNGHNTKLNCLEYHRDSEFNLGTENFILLLAKQNEITDGVLDISKVKAFWVPAGVMVECYATTLHYAPCHADPEKHPFRNPQRRSRTKERSPPVKRTSFVCDCMPITDSPEYRRPPARSRPAASARAGRCSG